MENRKRRTSSSGSKREYSPLKVGKVFKRDDFKKDKKDGFAPKEEGSPFGGARRSSGKSFGSSKSYAGKTGRTFGVKPFGKSDEKDSFGKRESRGGGFEKKRSFGGDKPSFGDRKPRRTFGEGESREKRSFGGEKPSFGERKPRSFDKDKPSFGDRKPRRTFGEGESREKRSFGGEKPSFGERKPRSFDKDKPSFGDRKPRRTFGEGESREKRSFGGEKPSFGERKPRSFDKDKPSFGDRKPRRTFGEGENPEKRTFVDRKPRTEGDENEVKPRRTFGGRNQSLGMDKEARMKNSFSKEKYPSKRISEEGGFDEFDESSYQNLSEQSFPKKERSFDKKAKSTKKEEPTREGIRLNRYISNAGICSRREADKLISEGLVEVNGTVVTEMGVMVLDGDVVKYDGRTLKTERNMYVLLNKPKDFITTTNDPQERKTVMNLVANACKERIYPVGRLDRQTTGLLLFTNDGALVEKLTHPSYQIKKIYEVELDRPLDPSDAEAIMNGLYFEEGKAIIDSMAVLDETRKRIGIEIHIGWNRIVRRIFEAKGYEVEKLDRMFYAGLTKKDLPRGTWRHLTEKEVIMLKHFKQ